MEAKVIWAQSASPHLITFFLAVPPPIQAPSSSTSRRKLQAMSFPSGIASPQRRTAADGSFRVDINCHFLSRIGAARKFPE